MFLCQVLWYFETFDFHIGVTSSAIILPVLQSTVENLAKILVHDVSMFFG